MFPVNRINTGEPVEEGRRVGTSPFISRKLGLPQDRLHDPDDDRTKPPRHEM